ncbi:hypothetical protein D3C84_671460 [compost metagenome]
MLENITRHDEVQSPNHGRVDIGDIDPGLLMVVGILVGHTMRQWCDISVPAAHADSNQVGTRRIDLRNCQTFAEQLRREHLDDGAHSDCRTAMTAGRSFPSQAGNFRNIVRVANIAVEIDSILLCGHLSFHVPDIN